MHNKYPFKLFYVFDYCTLFSLVILELFRHLNMKLSATVAITGHYSICFTVSLQFFINENYMTFIYLLYLFLKYIVNFLNCHNKIVISILNNNLL